MKTLTKFRFCLTRLVMLLICLWALAPQATSSTMFVKGASSAPYYKVDSGSYAQMSTSTTVGGVVWYYADVTSGSTVTFATSSSGSNASPEITFSSSADSYFFYNNGTGVNLTYQKDYTYCNYLTAGSWWTNDYAVFNCHMHGITSWPGQAETAVAGGTRNAPMYVYTASSTPTGLNFVRMNPSDRTNSSNVWNQTSNITSVVTGRHYTVTSADNNLSGVTTSDTYIVSSWPTKPAVTGKTYTLYVYDPNGEPTVMVDGTAATLTTEQGTHVTWYKYAFSGATLPNGIVIRDHNNEVSSATITPVDGATDYYYYPKYGARIWTATDANYAGPTVIYMAGSYAGNGWKLTPMNTNDGNEFVWTGTAFESNTINDNRFMFSSSTSWDDGYRPTTNGQLVIPGATEDAATAMTTNHPEGGENSWSIPKGLNYTIKFWASNGTFKVIGTPAEVPFYLVHWTDALSGSSPKVTLTTTDGINYTTGDVNLSNGEYFIFASSVGNDWNSTTRFTCNNGDEVINGDVTGKQATEGGNNAYKIGVSGTWNFTYNIATNTWSATHTSDLPKNTFTVYVKADAAPYLYAWNPEWHGEWKDSENLMTSTEQPLADGNTWYKVTYETYAESINFLLHNNGSDDNYHQSSNITQTKSVAYYVYDGATKCVETVEPTGKLYAIGQVAGNPWSATMGKEMTAAGNGIFTLNNVQIIAGSTFAFATRMADEGMDDDAAWAMLNRYRLTSAADGDYWGVTNAMTDKDNPTALELKLWNGHGKNFKMDETAYYDITVNMNTMTVTIKRASDALYMYYGSHWAPNAGVPMISTDGITYTLSNVTLAEGATFQFTKALGSNATTWPANEYRLGSAAQGEYWEVTTDELDIVLENALQPGSTKDFKMASGTAGTYRVVVNPTAKTVALYHMATVLDGKTIIHLEKTSNVTDPVLWAYDKETLAETGERIHVDRPSRKDIYDTRVKLTPKVLEEVTTVDGRKWWAWEVDNSITDFWFTREPYHYDGSNAPNDNMTDIQWRKSGEIYFTWPTAGTKLEEYTRDYYAAAAQEAAECAVMIEGHMYAYFTNTPGWEHVFCHAWNTDAQGVNHDLLTPPTSPDGLSTPRYPGALCELVGYDKDGYEVWRIDLTAAGVTTYPNGGILFNNGIDKPKDTKWDYFTGEEATIDKEQTGDFAYSTGACYDYCGLIVLGRSLSNIIRNGVVNGPVYTIEDDIVGVWFDPNAETKIEVDGATHTMYGALYCKDLNNFVTTPYVEKSLQKDGEIDYILQRTSLMTGKNRYDQSNWVKLTLSTQYPNYEAYFKNNPDNQKTELSKFVGFVLPAESVRGQLVNNYNPEMRLALQALPESNTVNNYSQDPNVFVTANFIGTQDCTEDPDEYGHQVRNTYFMVTPKPQEYAKITWAVYGTDGNFHVPKRGSYAFVDGKYEWMNEGDLNGYFPVKWDLQSNPGLVANQAYSFRAIIRLADQEQAASTGGTTTLRAAQDTVPYKPYSGTVKYVVSPIDLKANSIITAVNDINATTKTVRQVRYYNLAGIESSEPFDGINVVVTTYTDGSKSTAKILK